MKFSLIIGTLNRDKELEICLDSLLNQKYKEFEVIIIDQSDNDNTNVLCQKSKYKSLSLKYRHVQFRGLSKARNEALKDLKGDYFCLIDDDAEYSRDYLSRANEYINKYERNTILSGHIINNITQKTLKDYKNVKNATILSQRKIIRMCPSPGLIFPASVLGKIGNFDERFGVGGVYPAGEETDLILRCLYQGYKVRYFCDLKLLHPVILHSYEIKNTQGSNKMENYLYGHGAMFRKHISQINNKSLYIILIEKYMIYNIKKVILAKDKKLQIKLEQAALYRGWQDYKKREE